MKLKLVIALAATLLSTVATAEKPAWAGKGKPTQEQLEAQRAAMQERAEAYAQQHPEPSDKELNARERKLKDTMHQHGEKGSKGSKGSDGAGSNGSQGSTGSSDKEKLKEKKAKKDKEQKEKLTGLDKQQAKKAAQEQKELLRGSEQGKEARAKRKKWWQFWVADEQPSPEVD